MRPLLALVAIVKDEASNIAKTLESAKPFVDSWCILDTGSIDGTQEIVRSTMKDLPGALHEGPFEDYSAARNRALGLQDASDHAALFTLFLAGDEILEGGAALREFLEAHKDGADGAYEIEMRSGTKRWTYTRVLRADAKWRYVGDVHEIPQGPDLKTRGSLIPGAFVIYDMSDPVRHFKRVKEYDIPRLLKRVGDGAENLEERGQAIWHLAESYAEIADEHPRVPGGPWLSHKMAAMAMYWRRSELGDDTTKSNFAVFRYLNIAAQVGFYNDAEMFSRLEMLAELEPKFPEVRYMLAVHAAAVDVRKGAYYALEAARVAKEVKATTIHLPTDSRIEWLAFKLAAACARDMKDTRRMRSLAERGVAAGGPASEFQEFLEAA